jgi:LPXTG-motif cell wall-anchored protein
VKVLDRKTPGGPSEPPTRGPGPKTGDETKVLLPVMTAVMALIVLIAAARRKRG